MSGQHKKPPSVHTHWFRLCPGMSMGMWSQVAKVVRDRGIRANDRQSVRLICREIKTHYERKTR